MSSARGQSKNERRDAAREKAREQRQRQQRREKRNKVVLQVSIGVVILAIVAVVAVVIVNSVRPPGPGPRNMANGGITLSGAGLTPVTTGAAAASATPTPEPTKSGKVLIQVYEDFGCPVCQAFEKASGAQITKLVQSGAAEVQYHPVAILDNSFTDGDYSTNAANAAAVIANYSPAAYGKFHSLLYDTSVQPAEGSAGLSDDRLITLARQAGATNMTQVQKGIEGGLFKNWVTARTDEFTKDAGSLTDVDFPSSHTGAGTPTVIVNGKYFAGDPRDANAFGAFVTQVGGAYTATPTPTPSSSATPSPSASN